MLALLLFACTHDADGDGWPTEVDCDDGDAAVHPKAAEICDGVDQDCDTRVDEGLDLPWFMDVDGDGHGDAGARLEQCAAPEGAVSSDDDCDDADALSFPGADEPCDDPVDRNCDGSSGYADLDGDGVAACEDCDDRDGEVHPGATEVCNGYDDDCNSEIDDVTDGGADTFYLDRDGDGVGGEAVETCDPPEGAVKKGGDCDDADPGLGFGRRVPGDHTTVQAAVAAAEDGDLICISPGSYPDAVTVEGLTLTLRSLGGGVELGGGLSLSGGSVRLEGLDFVGVGVSVDGGELDLQDVSITEISCSADCSGSALDMDAAVVGVAGLRVEGLDLAGPVEGGAIRCLGSTLQGTDLRVSDFDVTGDANGGGLLLQGCTTTLDGLWVSGGRVGGASQVGGVGLANSEGTASLNDAVFADLEVDASVFVALGVGVFNSGTLSLVDSDLVGNESANAWGGALYDSGETELINVAMVGNRAALGAAMVSSGASVTYSLFYDNADASGSESSAFNGDPVLGEGVLFADPLYTDVSSADSSAWDLHPAAGSPLIDAGDPGLLDPDGSRSDIGSQDSR